MDVTHVEQKWGFGMAPIKAAVQDSRTRSVATTLSVLDSGQLQVSELEDLSVVKGLFNRVHRQDQWDWFTVWGQLGRPGGLRAKRISEGISDLRRSFTEGDARMQADARVRLGSLGAVDALRGYPRTNRVDSEQHGYIYILSTREARDMLKIGYTTRSVEDRVREINSATGVPIPYGVRAMWVVKNAREVEGKVHELLDEFRVRRDREFFDLDFKVAFALIRDYVRAARIEQ